LTGRHKSNNVPTSTHWDRLRTTPLALIPGDRLELVTRKLSVYPARLREARGGAVILAGLLILPAPAWAGDGSREFLIQSWTRDSGIPGDTVTAIAQTPDGYLWVGSFGGLARFDGVRFVSLDLRHAAGVSDTSVTCLRADRAGRLWIGTGDGHLIRKTGDSFQTFLPPSRQSADRYVQRMAEDAQGLLWTLNYEGSLSRSDGRLFVPINHPEGMLALVAGEADTVWAATSNQLLRAAGNQLQPVWGGTRHPEFVVGALATARAGGCWTAANGVVRRFRDGWTGEALAVTGYRSAAVLGFLEDRVGGLWLGTYGEGVFVVGTNGQVKHLTRRKGLPSDLVRCLFEDREGNVWAGLEGRGLARIRRALFASYGQTEGLSDETVLACCEGREGDIWVGTNGEGVYRIHRDDIQRYGSRDGLANQFVWALQEDRAGNLWAGTWGDGLFQLVDNRFVRSAQPAGGAIILALCADQTGRLWLGQRTGPNRVLQSLRDGRLESLPVPGHLPRLETRHIVEARDGSLWFDTMEEGLLRVEEGKVRRYGAADGLPPGGITALHVDDEGILWVAVAQAGLAFLEAERFVVLQLPPERLVADVSQISDDGRGYLWCGTSTGVVRFKKTNLREQALGGAGGIEWRRFSKEDGLPSNVCSGGGFRSRDGRIWFPTLAGLAMVNPGQVADSLPPPPVVIEEARVAGQPATGRSAFNRTTTGLRIPPGAGPVDIAYTAFDFAAPDQVRFRYQLLGLDDTPVEAGGTRVARYNRLPPGQYEFQVNARREGGEWNRHPATLRLEMLPRVWETSWFRLLVALAALGASAGIARMVILRRMQQRMAALERQHALEAERSRISQDLHDDLGTSLTEIKLLSAVASSPARSPAEVKDCLAGINHKALELVTALDEIVWAVNPRNDSLRNLVNYLCLFAQEFLRPASVQCRLDVPAGLPDLPLNAEQRHTLFLVTKEALANAAKHAAASEVWLRVAWRDATLSLAIEDNGRGFEEHALKPGRNGLTNIHQRMQQLGGRAEIQSASGQGTKVRLELRLP